MTGLTYLLLVCLQLLPPRYDFHKWKSKNTQICTCDQPDPPTAVAPACAIEKAKTTKDVLDKKAFIAGTAAPALQFLQTEKQKHSGICDQPDTPAAAAAVFAITKAKTAKDVLDKKSLVAGTPVLALRFLRAEKRKQIRATSLTHLLLLPPRYDFYNRKGEDTYLQPCRWHTCSCCTRVTIFMIGKAKIPACDPAAGTPVAAAPALRFSRAEKRKQVRATSLAQLPPRYDFYERKSKDRYLQSDLRPGPRVTIFTSGKVKTGTCNRRGRYRSQIHIGLHILGGKTGNCDCRCKYRSQIHVGLHIFDGKTGTCDRRGRYRS